MRLVFALWFLFLCCGITVAQEKTSSLLKQAEDLLYSDPQEAIKIATYIFEKPENQTQSIEAAYILTRGFYMQGNYDKALKTGLTFSKENFENDSSTQSELTILLAKILQELELNSLSALYLSKAIKQSEKSDETDLKFWVKGKVLQYDPEIYQEINNNQTKAQLYKTKKEFKKIKSEYYPNQIGNINLELAKTQLHQFQMDSVGYYLKKAYQESKAEGSGNYLEMNCLQEYGNYLLLKKEHLAAIDSLKSAEIIAVKFTNIEKQINIAEAIAENYLALNDLEKFNAYSKKKQTLNNIQTDIENEAVNVTFSFINDNQTKIISEAKNTLSRNFSILGIIIILLTLFWVLAIWRYNIKTKQYQSFTDYFEPKQKPDTPPGIIEEVIKSSAVPKGMEEALLLKLDEFENSVDFINKEMSLSRLALQFDTNTKYLSEVINTQKNKNFNAYINELRINYIIEKLKTDPVYLQYKVSYLVEISGFSSHSVFSSAFKSVTGISPTTFINILRNKKEESSSKIIKK